MAGLAAKTAIRAGDVICADKLSQPALISRNQVVMVEAAAGALVIQTRARAMADACVGDMVVCENPDTKGVFQGMVRSDGVVVIR